MLGWVAFLVWAGGAMAVVEIPKSKEFDPQGFWKIFAVAFWPLGVGYYLVQNCWVHNYMPKED